MSQRWSAYYAFAARAYELEAKNHGSFIRWYRELADKRRRGLRVGRAYQKAFLITNDYDGRLTTPRQEEWWSVGTRFSRLPGFQAGTEAPDHEAAVVRWD